jgi:hypothetical protein
MTRRRSDTLLGILAIVILIAIVATQVHYIAIYGINNRYWPHHLAEEAKEQCQRREYIQALRTYVRAYTLAIEGETRLFVAQLIIKRMNSFTDDTQYEQELSLCRLASRLAGRHDPEGVIGSRCATLETLIAVRDCEQSCSGVCNYIGSKLVCSDNN